MSLARRIGSGALAAALLLAAGSAVSAGDLPRRGTLGLEFDRQLVGGWLIVSSVEPGGAADRAGLRPGDRIRAADGTGFGSSEELQRWVGRRAGGQALRLRVGRGVHELDLALATTPVPWESSQGLLTEYGALEAGGLRLRAITLRPEGAGARLPAVLLMPGEGEGACDRTGPNPPRELARALAREGVVAMRFDPRGVGDSEGEADEATLDTAVAEAYAALRALRARPDVDPDRVVIFAAGEASVSAALLADANPLVSGVVLWAPLVRPVLEWYLLSMRRQQEIGGVPEARARRIIDEVGRTLALILASVEIERIQELVPETRTLWDRRGRFLSRTAEHWRGLNDPRALAAWPRVRGPILLLRGEFDIGTPDGEIEILTRLLDDGSHPSHRAEVLPGLEGDMGRAGSELEALRRSAAGDLGAEGSGEVAARLKAWMASPGWGEKGAAP